jgi:hypothetical protein
MFNFLAIRPIINLFSKTVTYVTSMDACMDLCITVISDMINVTVFQKKIIIIAGEL